jgi:hemolysin D
MATAQGKIVPNGRTKTIQAFETATVKAIHVTDGQSVKAGEVLIALDATTTQADLAHITGELMAAGLQVARASAMLAALDGGKPPVLLRPPGVDAARLQEAQRLLLGQHDEYLAKLMRVEAEIGRREAELRSAGELVRKFEQTAPIAAQRALDFKNLAEQEFVSRHGYLEREQARIEQESELANQRSRLRESESALQEARAQHAAIIAETRRMSLDSLTEGRQKAAALQQERVKAASHDQLMQLTSPIDGTVQQLAVHTVGGVVTAAQPLMAVVPRDNQVEVEAFIENKDIGFIAAGQEAEVKVDTFQYTKYGTLHGKVISVSHDAIPDEKRGLIFSTRIALERASIDVDARAVHVGAGMAVSVEIKTGKRRVIDYFLSPLMQTARESLRER